MSAAAQLPEFYKRVDRIVWIVEDSDRAVTGLTKLGFVDFRSNGEVSADVEYRGKPTQAQFAWTVGRIGDVVVDLIEPVSDVSAFHAFGKQHGAGVMALLHRTPTRGAFDAEIRRMRSLGVEVLQSGGLPPDSGDGRYVLFDTEEEGKYILGLIYAGAGEYSGDMAPPPATAKTANVSQYAFVVRELEAVSQYWSKLGFPEMTVTHPATSELMYRGRPGSFDMQLGWQRHGRVPYEWILSTRAPNVYEDHLDKHGEGFHHLAFNVEQMDAEMARWTRAGFPVSQAGAWGDKGQPGSGRFAYQDLHDLGGIDIELLWNFKPRQGN
jgi:hypothetical protein